MHRAFDDLAGIHNAAAEVIRHIETYLHAGPSGIGFTLRQSDAAESDWSQQTKSRDRESSGFPTVVEHGRSPRYSDCAARAIRSFIPFMQMRVDSSAFFFSFRQWFSSETA